MKRALRWSLTLAAAFAMAGCPVFPDDHHGCVAHSDCAPGYLCDEVSGFCHASPGSDSGTCSSPAQCSSNQTCGRDGRCHPGSCRIESTGCVAGFACEVMDGAWTCVPADAGSPVDASSAGAAGASGASGAAGAPSAGGAAGASSSGGAAGAAGAGGAAGAPGSGGAAGAGNAAGAAGVPGTAGSG